MRDGPISNPGAFRAAILEWGRHHFRPFPWRSGTDPYRVLIAGMMLRRTAARQVAAVYPEFLRRYPDPQRLAGASPATIGEILRPLGLRWRAAQFVEMAGVLVERHRGTVPGTRAELQALPGVGDYVASMVLCLALGHAEPLVDTNTVRVLCRAHGLTPGDSMRRRRDFRALASALVDPAEPARYNLALLDLADTVCTAVHPPRCPACPVRHLCVSAERSL